MFGLNQRAKRSEKYGMIKDKESVRDIPVPQLREALSVWRKHGPNPSTFDRIEDLIDEIERLRGNPLA